MSFPRKPRLPTCNSSLPEQITPVLIEAVLVRQAIKAAGARLGFVPPYSPDLNPIERTFAKIKHWMRNAQKRTVEDAWRHVGSLVDTITPAERRIRFSPNMKRSNLLAAAAAWQICAS